MRLIIVSGLSGSGKTVALHHFEDLGFYCIDNMPAALLATLIGEITATQDPLYANLAIGIDARNRAADLARLPEMVRDLRARGMRCEVIFLHADDNILLKRFGETRRKHPLSAAGFSLREAIDRERQLLGPIIASAELVLDTTRTSIYELRDIIRRRVGAQDQPGLSHHLGGILARQGGDTHPGLTHRGSPDRDTRPRATGRPFARATAASRSPGGLRVQIAAQASP